MLTPCQLIVEAIVIAECNKDDDERGSRDVNGQKAKNLSYTDVTTWESKRRRVWLIDGA